MRRAGAYMFINGVRRHSDSAPLTPGPITRLHMFYHHTDTLTILPLHIHNLLLIRLMSRFKSWVNFSVVLNSTSAASSCPMRPQHDMDYRRATEHAGQTRVPER